MTDETLNIDEALAETSAPELWSGNIVFASFYARLAAFLLDFAILLVPLSIVLTNVFVLTLGDANMSRAELSALVESKGHEAANMAAIQQRLPRMMNEYLAYGLAAGVVWLTFWYFFSATPGKMLFKIRIVDSETGMPPSLKRYIIRYFGLIFSGLMLGLGFFWVQWNKRRRSWHDMMAKTYVVKSASLPAPQSTATLAALKKAKSA